jgi:tRNA(fMet)-specific endonuclease VapC
MSPLYVLDTDICSYVIKNKPPEARRRMNAVPLDRQAISVVTYAELLYGVKRSSNTKVNRTVVDAFVRHLSILDWSQEAAEHYADVRAHLETAGTPIGAMDLMIAAHARSLDAVLVTNNERHFRKVPGLAVENWLSAPE